MSAGRVRGERSVRMLAILAVGVAHAAATGQDSGETGSSNWPQWRGVDQNGVSHSTGLSQNWGLETNIRWRSEMPSWGGGTPIVWGDYVFITSASEADPAAVRQEPENDRGGNRGRRGGRGGRGGSERDPGGDDLLLLCLSRKSGEVLWRRVLDSGNELHRKSNDASPSPVTDGSKVWAVTGTGVVTAFDLEGNELWSHSLQEEYGPFQHLWGYASSPLLHDGTLYVQVLHGFKARDPSYVVAYDAESGDVLWRVERPTDAPRESPDAYTTPLLIERGGQEILVISGGDYVTGHDLATGTELWRVGGLNPRGAPNYRIVASPLLAGDRIIAPTRVKPMLALELAEDITEAPRLAWQWNGPGSPDVPTPASDGERIYMLDDAGLITCIDPATGEAVWGPERTVRGTVSSSPLLADGKVYFTNEEAVTVVVEASDEFKILATNELDGSYTLSSPVAAGGEIFIRTATHLYCIGNE